MLVLFNSPCCSVPLLWFVLKPPDAAQESCAQMMDCLNDTSGLRCMTSRIPKALTSWLQSTSGLVLEMGCLHWDDPYYLVHYLVHPCVRMKHLCVYTHTHTAGFRRVFGLPANSRVSVVLYKQQMDAALRLSTQALSLRVQTPWWGIMRFSIVCCVFACLCSFPLVHAVIT